MDRLHAVLRCLNDDARHLRYLFRFRRGQRVLRQWQNQPTVDAGDRTCLLDLRHTGFDGEQGRRFHALVTLLRQSGHRIWLIPRIRFLHTGVKAFKQRALFATQPYDSATSPKHFDLCLTDSNRCPFSADKVVQLTRDVTRTLSEDEVPVPYGFFPDVWEQGEGERVEEYQTRPRRWRLFFAGHCQAKAYRKISKFKQMSTLNRFDVLKHCGAHFGDRTLHVQDQNHLAECALTNHRGFVMVDSVKIRIETHDWLRTLSTANFFLAAPGCDYPMAHNCIESLAVGTIPVLEYSELFTPALQDGTNCLTYSGVRGFRQTLQRLEQMSDEDISRLRQGAIRYWNEHLSPKAFRRALKAPSTKRIHMFSYLMRRGDPIAPASTTVQKRCA